MAEGRKQTTMTAFALRLTVTQRLATFAMVNLGDSMAGVLTRRESDYGKDDAIHQTTTNKAAEAQALGRRTKRA